MFTTYRIAPGLLLSLILVLAILAPSLQAQTVDNVDEAFLRARNLAFDGQREEARQLSRAILEIAPGYTDVRLLIVRTYMWDGNLDNARSELNTILGQAPYQPEALALLADVEYRSGNYDEALRVVQLAARSNPTDIPLLIRRAEIYRELGDYRRAHVVLNQVEHIEPSSSEAARVRATILTSSQNYSLTLGYGHDRFDAIFDPWNSMYLQLGRSTPIGTVLGRINYANRFNTDGYQAEIDFYPSIRPGTYGYLNFGYSDSFIFPEYRFGAEIHQALPKAFEVSVGFRHLEFQSGGVTIYTGSLSKYYRNWYLSARPFITPRDEGVSNAYQFIFRRYFSDPDNYIGLRGGFGFSPDERRLVAGGIEEINLLRAHSVGLEGYTSFRYNLLGFASVTLWNQQRPITNEYLGSLSVTAGLVWRF
ncbi:MAG: YaiO family outer membrane beta-barrel protein [Balneolaceae bacterium]|nr:MAG: YaiO family outer membrane beta-barrel protein [Balneolaceae bacterium]